MGRRKVGGGKRGRGEEEKEENVVVGGREENSQHARGRREEQAKKTLLLAFLPSLDRISAEIKAEKKSNLQSFPLPLFLQRSLSVVRGKKSCKTENDPPPPFPCVLYIDFVQFPPPFPYGSNCCRQPRLEKSSLSLTQTR